MPQPVVRASCQVRTGEAILVRYAGAPLGVIGSHPAVLVAGLGLLLAGTDVQCWL
jgi:hypothetical protein